MQNTGTSKEGRVYSLGVGVWFFRKSLRAVKPMGTADTVFIHWRWGFDFSADHALFVGSTCLRFTACCGTGDGQKVHPLRDKPNHFASNIARPFFKMI